METTKEIIGFRDLGFWVRGSGVKVGFVQCIYWIRNGPPRRRVPFIS